MYPITFSYLFCLTPAIHDSKSSWSFGFRFCFKILGLGSCKKGLKLEHGFIIIIIPRITVFVCVCIYIYHLCLPLSQCLQQCLLQLSSVLFFQFWPEVDLSTSANHFHLITHKNPVFSVRKKNTCF